MEILKNGKKALSLFEILISMILFSIALVGLVNVFIISKQYILHNRMRMTASQVAKFFLSGTNQLVVSYSNASNTNNCLYNNGICTVEPLNVNGVAFNASYNTTAVTGVPSELRKVIITVNWNETDF